MSEILDNELKIIKGTTFAFDIELTDENNLPVDLTGATIYFTAKENISDDDDDAVIKKDITDITNPTTGKATITLTAADTNITVGQYVYDIVIKNSVNEIYVVTPEGCLLTIVSKVTQRVSE
jgi:hypothetical protein